MDEPCMACETRDVVKQGMEVITMESRSTIMVIGMVGLDMEVEAEVVLQDAVSGGMEGDMMEICIRNQNITMVMVDQGPCLLKAVAVVVDLEGLVAVVKVRVSDPMHWSKKLPEGYRLLRYCFCFKLTRDIGCLSSLSSSKVRWT